MREIIALVSNEMMDMDVQHSAICFADENKAKEVMTQLESHKAN